MHHYLLGWADAGLLTLDLDDDRRVVLVLDQAALAGQLALAIGRSAGRAVQVSAIDVPVSGIRDALDLLMGIQDRPESLALVLPGERLHGVLVDQLLRG